MHIGIALIYGIRLFTGAHLIFSSYGIPITIAVNAFSGGGSSSGGSSNGGHQIATKSWRIGRHNF